MMEIRLATPADLPDVTRLLVAFRDYYGEKQPEAPVIEATVAQLLGERRTGLFLLAAPSLDAAPIGFAQLRFRLSVWTGTEDAWLEDLFVEEASRGDGAGKALTEACIELARGRGCGRIQLDANENNPNAIALYEALGFASGRESRFGGAKDLYFTKWLT